MKNLSFYQIVLKEIHKTPLKRISLVNYTRLIRQRVQDVPSTQLLFLYSQLYKLKCNNSQFHCYNHPDNYIKNFRQQNKIPMMKYESYEKNTLLCLQQIAIKLKEKNGFEEGVDLCKLFYLRLLNAIQYHIPYLNVLEQFREEFLWKDVRQEVIDYVAIIEKDPSQYDSVFVETVNLLIQAVAEQLQNIDVLQLPYLKSVLSKGKKYKVYQIDDSLFQRLDELINQNKFAFKFKQLEHCLILDSKHPLTHHYYALLNKDLVDKRLNYLFIDQKKDILLQSKPNQNFPAKKQIGLPGKSVSQDSIDWVLNKMSEMSFYSVYINIFDNLTQGKYIKKLSLLKKYVRHHFNYFSKSGNLNCKTQEIIQVLENTLKDQGQLKNKGLKIGNLEILRLFFVIEMLIRKQISGNQLVQSHNYLKEEIQTLSKIQKPKFEHLAKIFQSSTPFYQTSQPKSNPQNLMSLFSNFLQNSKQNQLVTQISEQLSFYSPIQKKFITDEIIIYLIKNGQDNQQSQFNQAVAKLLEVLMKSQFKKFSVESLNIQKILSLIRQKNH